MASEECGSDLWSRYPDWLARGTQPYISSCSLALCHDRSRTSDHPTNGGRGCRSLCTEAVGLLPAPPSHIHRSPLTLLVSLNQRKSRLSCRDFLLKDGRP